MPLDRFQLQQNISSASNPARYLTDTTSFDQLNAISSVQGLTLITSNRFNAVTAVSINNCFTSLSQNYRVLLTLTDVVANSDFTLRLRSGGFDNISSRYDNVWSGIDSSGTSNNIASGALSSFNVGEQLAGNNTSIRYKILLDFFSPAEPVPTSVLGQYSFVNKLGTLAIVRNGSGLYQSNESFDGFSFISSVASSISGVVRVYGYKI